MCSCVTSYRRLVHWITLLYVVHHGRSQPFNCTGTCWAMPNYAPIGSLDTGVAVSDSNHALWKCDKCPCDYGNWIDSEGSCQACNTASVAHGIDLLRVMLLTAPKGTSALDCDQVQVCMTGYYNFDTSATKLYPNHKLPPTCSACDVPVTNCGRGNSSGRCTPYSNTGLCVPCTYPAIPNGTSMMYGFSKELPDCTDALQPPGKKRMFECICWYTFTW
jgi:hypothetical protein